MNRSAFALALALLMASAVDGTAQRRPAPDAPGKPLTLVARIGGKAYEAAGPGSCRHAPEASIYDLPAALWMVEYGNPADGKIKQVHLTVWKPKDGSRDQISLALEAGSSRYQIASGGRAPSGSASVKLSPSGPGGRFELKGKDAKGTNIELTIDCPAFAGVEAEGG